MFKTARNKSGGANAVNLARDTAGILKNAFESIITKRGSGEKTGNVEMVVNIFNGIGEVEGWNLVSIGEALAKSLMDGKMKGLVQNRRTHQEQGPQRPAVHVGGKQEAKLLKSRKGKKVGLINNEQGETLFGANEFIKGRTNACHHFRLGKEGFIAECKEDISKEAAHAEGGI